MSVKIKDIIKIFIFPFVVFMANYIVDSTTNYYDTLWWPNRLMHFLGGLSMVISGFFILNLAKRFGWIKTKNIIVDIFLLTFFVMAIGVIWEFNEFFSDTYFYTHSQPSNADTMKDLIMDTLGSVFFCLGLWVKKLLFKTRA